MRDQPLAPEAVESRAGRRRAVGSCGCKGGRPGARIVQQLDECAATADPAQVIGERWFALETEQRRLIIAWQDVESHGLCLSN